MDGIRSLSWAIRFLRTHTTEHGFAQSVRELQGALDLPSTGTAHDILCRLEERGQIRRRERTPRALAVTEEEGTGAA